MACWTCSPVTWNSSSSVRCLVFLSMMWFILLVLRGVEFTNCLLKDCAMLSDLDLSLLLNCMVEVDLISLLGNQVSSSICMCLFCGLICLIAFLSIGLFCVQQAVYLFLCLGFQFLDL